MFNGNLLFTYVTRDDLDEINTQFGGISCIHYHNGLYIQSARFVLKRIAGKDFSFCIYHPISALCFKKNCRDRFQFLHTLSTVYPISFSMIGKKSNVQHINVCINSELIILVQSTSVYFVVTIETTCAYICSR